MGINLNAGFSRMIKGKRSWKEFSGKALCMLGKQDVNFNRGKLKEVLHRTGFDYKKDVKDVIEIDDFDERDEKIDSYDLFRLLGFTHVHALDISGYEGADIICDLAAEKLPEELLGRFDYVYDGGVTEHIFDFPRAMMNLAKMLKIGGKVIHDVPCGNFIDHGFYSFSPTCLVDYYTNNGFAVEDIYLMGYRYPNFEMANVISPDCRYNDANAWCSSFANGCNILLVCEATKEESPAGNVSFTQHSYKVLEETLKMRKERYSYPYRINKIRQIMEADAQCRVAVYGSGITADKILRDLEANLHQVVGVYDLKIESGSMAAFSHCKMRVLDIEEVQRDRVRYIIIGSEKENVIEIIRQRIKRFKREGIEII